MKKSSDDRYKTKPQHKRMLLSPKRLLSLLSKANRYLKFRNPNVVCVPVLACPILYGSDSEHFTVYGYVTPTQSGCLGKYGLALCIEESHTVTTQQTTESGVTCVPVASCQTIYGTDPQHFMEYGYISPTDANCFSKYGLVLCVSEGTGPAYSTTTSLPVLTSSVSCVPVMSCHTLYGSSTDHFALYGYITPTQSNCLSKNGVVLCVVSDNDPVKPIEATVVSAVGVTCVPVAACQTIYGSRPQHFIQYGYITPTQTNCLSGNGLVLCVTSEFGGNSPPPIYTTEKPTTQYPTSHGPTRPAIGLPCVPMTECRVIFGSMYQHNMFYGEQKECSMSYEKRCVAVEPYVPTTPATTIQHFNTAEAPHHHSKQMTQHSSTSNILHTSLHKPSGTRLSLPPPHYSPSSTSEPPNHIYIPPISFSNLNNSNVLSVNTSSLPCVPPTHCNKIYGTSYEHFIHFKYQNKCENPGMMRCIETVGPPSSIATKPDTQSHYTPLIPSTESNETPYKNIQIIGPKPIYLSLSHVEGPTVLSHNELRNTETLKNSKYEQHKGLSKPIVEWRDNQNGQQSTREEPKRLYLQGLSLEKLFNSNARNNRNAKQYDKSDAKLAPYDETEEIKRAFKSFTRVHKNGAKPQMKIHGSHINSFETIFEKKKKPHLSVDSYENLFFADGGKIKVPYDTDENSNNYLFFSPNRKLRKLR